MAARAIAVSLEALVNHQATNEADSRAELVHRKTNHRHFRLLEAPGHDVIDGQGNESRVRCGLLQGLRVWSYPPRLRLSHTQIEALCPVVLTDFMQADLSHCHHFQFRAASHKILPLPLQLVQRRLLHSPMAPDRDGTVPKRAAPPANKTAIL